MRWTRLLGIMALGCAVAAGAAAREGAQAVSPGEQDRAARVEGLCPTFSWTAVAGAESYELLVYELSAEAPDGTAEPALSRVLPGGARSWTPGLEDCLDSGRSYAWFVRAAGEGIEDGWSEERLFRTEAPSTSLDPGQALAVLERYLSEGGSLQELAGEAPSMAAMAGSDAPRGEPRPQASRAGAPSGSRQRLEEPPLTVASSPVPAAALPLRELGLSVSSANAQIAGAGDAIAMRGEYQSTNSSDHVVGYLGVAASDTLAGDFDGFPDLWPVGADEMGVLGYASDSTDNYGVVGAASGNASGGRFFNLSDGEINVVRLGTPGLAIHAQGNVSIFGNLTVSECRGAHQAGRWCIGEEQAASTYNGARYWCWLFEKQLCPLDAILACASQRPSGADCTTATNLEATKWIWCAELEEASNNDVDAFTNTGRARVFASQGNHTTDELDFHDKTQRYVFYCCDVL